MYVILPNQKSLDKERPGGESRMSANQGGGEQLDIHTLSELGDLNENDGIQIVDDPDHPCGRVSCEGCDHESTCASAEIDKL